MNPDFETSSQKSTEGKGTKVEFSEEFEGLADPEKHQKQASERVEEFMEAVDDLALDRLNDNPEVELKGRSWKLEQFDEKSEEYWKIAFWQKQAKAITNRVQEISYKAEAVDPSSADAGVYHYEMQILAGLKDFLQRKSSTHAKEVGLASQHPEIYSKLTKLPEHRMN